MRIALCLAVLGSFNAARAPVADAPDAAIAGIPINTESKASAP